SALCGGKAPLPPRLRQRAARLLADPAGSVRAAAVRAGISAVPGPWPELVEALPALIADADSEVRRAALDALAAAAGQLVAHRIVEALADEILGTGEAQRSSWDLILAAVGALDEALLEALAARLVRPLQAAEDAVRAQVLEAV